MISIVVPIYNAEPYLLECLESLMIQSYEDFEVLMVDDGSKDNSLAICREWAAKDERFRVFSQANAGVSVARNRALEEANGDYVCFVDADDAVAPDYLAHLLDLSKNGDFPLCWYTRDKAALGTGGKTTERYEAKQFVLNIVNEIMVHANIWEMLFKLSIIKEHDVRFTPGCIRNEDMEFFIHYLLYEQHVVVSDYRAYYYRPNPSSEMAKPVTKQAMTSIEAAGRIDKLLLDKGWLAKDGIVQSSRVLAYAFALSRQKNSELYAYLHDQYDVKSALRTRLSYPGFKKKTVALLYLVLGKRLFFSIIGMPIWKLFLSL